MIVPMKKVTVLCLGSHREGALEYLRDLGVLHLEPVRVAESEGVEQARRDLEYIRRALEILPARPHMLPSGRTPIQVVRALWKLIHERNDLREELEGLEHEIQRVDPFGAFDPEMIRGLAGKGISVRLFHASPREQAAAPEGAVVIETARTKTAVYFAVIHRGAGEVKNAQEVRLPERSPAQMTDRVAAIRERLAAIEQEAAEYGGDHPHVSVLEAEAHDNLRLAEARAGMGAGAGDRVVYLRGYCPQEDVGCLVDAARTGGWGLVIDDPDPEDHVPTLLRTARWVRPIGALMEFIGIKPGYREVDVSALFLVFFGLFFAMLVGDAGYGALFLAASLIARRRLPRAPRTVFALLEIMSVCTIAWGMLTGNYFGIMTRGVLGRASEWLQKPDNVMALCFGIGVVHLSVAHLWNLWRMRATPQALAQIGWLGTTWTMYFLANKMVLGFAFPAFMGPVFVVSVVLIVLFMTPLSALKAEWFNHVMLPLNLVSNFVDVVSYIRLFAVGTASAAVAGSFNAMLAPMFGHWASGLVAAVFLFLAHALNIVLSLMGVMVHGVRLNTLEFSGHVGLQWTGLPYRPFCKTPRSDEG